MKYAVPSNTHFTLRQELVGVLCKYQDTLCPAELLAVSSQVVGNLIALQDETRLSPEHAIEIVMYNIEEGNRAALGDLDQTDAA
ncbi:MAG: hypothetical protein RIE06_05640 [Roseibium album]|uniref:Uncharacterized protein n=1 Tax=Roseibium album TaxID=311410 RepID=A0A0M6ZKZ0_9HYPH|nr:hypothetical protein [Roseibium album]MBG6148051.1 hypothetical protein [Labrenzia sp. EL_142]MBG6154594.1 hypothetical protein [Labrenzia sp. EL_162]MBG6161872.1 hypothetical protein [Labrenzia sp. EL_195]MBG6176372.1 hypothetical protein [Labrenzia sp. EL_132]MBG6193276.1 hypothetical protein [Labrenzia sp. EL_159]MBG6209996.1 hypothetical protein [Labrenzia sp. EL_126]MBG6231159.1 hypothetical protein [Labrenzia sp. EL_208]MCR9059577.1 hypothetical protein [Paracoccaceae bacterium]